MKTESTVMDQVRYGEAMDQSEMYGNSDEYWQRGLQGPSL